MSMLSLSLYGSRARHDYSKSSDTDLFAITDDQRYQMLVNGKTNIACYPVDLAISRANGGDLFFLHIVTEAISLYDPQKYFEGVRGAFRYKKSYQSEVRNASELGYALLRNNELAEDFSLYNKRLVWCIRTILIARCAEEKQPKFSAEDLSHHFGEPCISRVISIKDSDEYQKEAYNWAYKLVKLFGVKPSVNMPAEYEDLISYFKDTGNFMGERTARLFSHDIETDKYGWF